MRQVVLVAGIILMAAGACHADIPPIGYIGLFADEDHSVSCVRGVGFYPIEMWIWCLPSIGGMLCVEFGVSYPENVIRSTITGSPYKSVSLGTLEDGMSICMTCRQWDWVWTHHQLLYVADDTPTWIEIVGHPDLGWAQFAPCYPGY